MLYTQQKERDILGVYELQGAPKLRLGAKQTGMCVCNKVHGVKQIIHVRFPLVG